MRSIIKKLFCALLVVMMIMTNMVNTAITYADEALKVELEVINMDGNTINRDTDFWVNTPISAAADILVSGSGPAIVEPWVVLTVPKSPVINKPTFIDSQKAYATVKGEDANNWYVIYKFNELTGGTRMTFPFPFSFKEDPTRNGDTITVKLDMVNAANVEDKGDNTPAKVVETIKTLDILHSSQKTYKALKQEFQYDDTNIHAYAYNRYDSNAGVYHYNVSVATGQQTTGQPGKTLQIGFSMIVDVPQNIQGTISYIKPTNHKIVVHLPEGVKPPNDREWQYDETTHTATFTRLNPGVSGKNSWRGNRPGQTYWPTWTFTDKAFNQVFEIKADYYVDGGLATERQLPSRTIKIQFDPVYFQTTGGLRIQKDNLTNSGTAPIKYWLDEGAYVIVGDEIYDKSRNQTENGLFYTLDFYNQNNGSALDNPEGGIVSDVYTFSDLISNRVNDHRTYYKSFTLGEVYATSSSFSSEKKTQLVEGVKRAFNETPNVLYGIKDDGTKVKLAENIKYQQKVTIEDTEALYGKLSLEVARPIRLNNTNMRFYVQTFPTKEERDKFSNGTYTSKQTYTGTAEGISADGQNPGTAEADRKLVKLTTLSGYTSLEPIKPLSWVSVQGSQTVAYQSTGTFVNYNASVYLSAQNGTWGPLADEELKNVKTITLLPPAFKFVSLNWRGTYGEINQMQPPEIVENYKGTGRTAVIETIPRMIAGNTNLRQLNTSYKLEITPYASRGANKIETFLVYPKNNVIKPWDGSVTYKDALDLDNDNDVEELYASSKSTINYIPPLELLIKKQVGFTKDALGVVSTNDLGSEFYYNIGIFNNTIDIARKVSVIDTLPYVGDHAIVANKEGQYLPRNSKFSTPLTRSVESLPENAVAMGKFNVLYQMEPQGPTLQSVRDGQWIPAAQVTDFSKVKSIKFDLKPGSVIASKEEVNILLPVQIPYDKELIPGELAVNTAAASTDEVRYAEANTAGATFAKYKVSGIAFKDANDDGVNNNDESAVSGMTVELIDAATGEVAEGRTGKLITKTDADGKYNFEVIKRGNYRVRFIKKDEEVFAPVNGRATDMNNIETAAGNNGETRNINISPQTTSPVLNGALLSLTKDLTIHKVSTVLDATGSEVPLSGAVFELFEGNRFIDRATTNSLGLAIFRDLPFGTYRVVEQTPPPGFEVDSNRERSITVDRAALLSQKFANSPILRDVKVTKVDADNDSIKLENVVFGLFKAGSNTPEFTATTGNNGVALFRNVPYGTYTLKEVSTITGYALDTAFEKTVNISEKGQALDMGTVTNARIRGAVTVKKVDFDQTATGLKGVTFVLESGIAGAAAMSAVTNDDGLATFPSVPYGTYTLREVQTLDNYIMSTETRTVTVSEAGKVVDAGIFKNKKIKGSITIHKTGDGNSPLGGVVFGLFKGNTEIARKTTEPDGTAKFNDVEYGDYNIIELQTLSGYILNNTPVEVKVRNDGEEKVLNLVNNLIPPNVTPVIPPAPAPVDPAPADPLKGTIKIIKTDEKGNPLQGVVFSIKEVGKEKVLGTTDAKGELVFTGLNKGKYLIEEVKGLKGFETLKKTIDAELVNDGEKVEIKLINKKVKITEDIKPGGSSPKTPDKPQAPKTDKDVPTTGGEDNRLLYLLLMMASATSLVALRRKENGK